MRCSPSDNRQQAAGKGALYYPCEHRVAVLHCGLYIPNEPQTVDTIKPCEGGFSVWSRLLELKMVDCQGLEPRCLLGHRFTICCGRQRRPQSG